jgi:hypothetical protein
MTDKTVTIPYDTFVDLIESLELYAWNWSSDEDDKERIIMAAEAIIKAGCHDLNIKEPTYDYVNPG